MSNTSFNFLLKDTLARKQSANGGELSTVVLPKSGCPYTAATAASMVMATREEGS